MNVVLVDPVVPHPIMGSLGLYFLLVLLPQLVWLLSHSSEFSALCEDCSFLIPTEDPALLPTKETHPEQSEDSSPHTSRILYDMEVGSVPTNYGLPTLASIEDATGGSHCHDNHCSPIEYMNSMQYHNSFLNHRLHDNHSVIKDCNISLLCQCRLDHSHRIWESLGESDSDGGWNVPHPLPDLRGPCTITKVNSSLSQQEFLERFAYKEPVVLTGISHQSVFRAHSTKLRLLMDYGHEIITAATANSHSYHKVKMTLCKYIDKIMKPQTNEGLGNETLYYFGDNDREGWSRLFSLYQLPPIELPELEPVLSFGLAGPGTGVPFHVHGPVFAETIYGRKRWFLYHPHHKPQFHPNATTLHWVTYTYPHLSKRESTLMECTLEPGEILYVPDGWWHATLNVDTTVFMSTFYS